MLKYRLTTIREEDNRNIKHIISGIGLIGDLTFRHAKDIQLESEEDETMLSEYAKSNEDTINSSNYRVIKTVFEY